MYAGGSTTFESVQDFIDVRTFLYGPSQSNKGTSHLALSSVDHMANLCEVTTPRTPKTVANLQQNGSSLGLYGGVNENLQGWRSNLGGKERLGRISPKCSTTFDRPRTRESFPSGCP
ncbi:hypothetical protein VNO77_14589 [Canavalia gladiata]|uniref:Uncharacterized protein n=1 Tax=Canavalia gladiata TaxID=3824 RepID=A0AAN9M3L6_CANGL